MKKSLICGVCLALSFVSCERMRLRRDMNRFFLSEVRLPEGMTPYPAPAPSEELQTAPEPFDSPAAPDSSAAREALHPTQAAPDEPSALPEPSGTPGTPDTPDASGVSDPLRPGRLATMIVYVDSLSCSSCQIDRLYEYGPYIDLAAESDAGFRPLFVFTPRQGGADGVRYALSVARFGHPVLLDEAGDFPRSNPRIPDDHRFHVFLLDRDSRVVLAGDPCRNPALGELYMKTIRNLLDHDGRLPE